MSHCGGNRHGRRRHHGRENRSPCGSEHGRDDFGPEHGRGSWGRENGRGHCVSEYRREHRGGFCGSEWGTGSCGPNCETNTTKPPQKSGQFSMIRNPQTDLVLDASEAIVKIQKYTGSDAQLWKVEPVENGRSFFVNKSNGNVLDIQGGEGIGSNLITYQKQDGLNQQWTINANDSTITSVIQNLALDVEKGELRAGNAMIVYPKHGRDNQQFLFIQI